MKLKDILSLVSCPEDHCSLEYYQDYLQCTGCGMQYPVLGNNFVELLPETISFHDKECRSYWEGYKKQFERDYIWLEQAVAWGRCDLASPAWAAKRLKQVEFVKGLLAETAVICDISGGAGTYTFELAKSFDLVIHCDLSIENLNNVYRQKQQEKIDNLILIRCDYFSLPFFNSLPQLICTDTLIRGHNHERALLASLHDALSDTGKALVDFHNWWHNPLRRLGLLPQNFGSNTSYTKEGAEKLLFDSGIFHLQYFPFSQEQFVERSALFKKIIPPTRLMYQFTR